MIGWYRFVGAAGNMMLNYCPSNMSNNDYHCGARFKLWMNGSLPEQSDGIVTRYVNGYLELNETLGNVLKFNKTLR